MTKRKLVRRLDSVLRMPWGPTRVNTGWVIKNMTITARKGQKHPKAEVVLFCAGEVGTMEVVVEGRMTNATWLRGRR